MRSEIAVKNFTKIGSVGTASEAPGVVDVANGLTIPLDDRGTAGLTVVIKNNGAETKKVTMLVSAPHPWVSPLVLNIPPSTARYITKIGEQYYAGSGRLDFDFEAGFTGEIMASRLS